VVNKNISMNFVVSHTQIISYLFSQCTLSLLPNPYYTTSLCSSSFLLQRNMELSMRPFLFIHHVSVPIFSSSYRNSITLPHRSVSISSSPLLFSQNLRSVTVCTTALEVTKTEKEYFPASGIRVTEFEQPNSCVSTLPFSRFSVP
jgi:hypothetical protein